MISPETRKGPSPSIVKGKEVNMQQVTELLKAAGEFLAGLGAVIAPIATVVIALHRKPEPRRPPRRRRRR